MIGSDNEGPPTQHSIEFGVATPNVESEDQVNKNLDAPRRNTENNNEPSIRSNNGNGNVVPENQAVGIELGDNNNNNDEDVEDVNNNNGETRDSEFVRQWKASPFAVGYTKPTWKDELSNCFQMCVACCSVENSRNAYVYFTAGCCQCLPVGRVGNMVVFMQRMVEYDADDNDDTVVVIEQMEEETSQDATPNTMGSGRRQTRPPQRHQLRRRRPKLVCVVGPYFVITASLTLPVLVFLTTWTFYRAIWDGDLHWAVIVIWALSSFAMLLSLLKTSCSDPGILYRYARIPSWVPTDNVDKWRWNDQALTYRPPGAKYDPDVQCVVEQYDHTCPWVGTAIGKGNMAWFQRFLLFMTLSVVFDVILLTIT